MWRHAAGAICVINARALGVPLTSYRVSRRDRIAELSSMIAVAILIE